MISPMSLRRIISTLAIIGGVYNSALMAQSVETKEWIRFSDVQRTNGWLHSENASGLITLQVKKMSKAAINTCIKSGNFHNYYDSNNEYSFSANASSYYRLSKRIVMSGEVEFCSRQVKKATGSYFIDPTQTPFDLVEFTSENPGDKKFEKYRLAGGAGVDLNRWLSLGAKLDYTAANYSKRKDLRHINSLLDMTVTAGVAFHLHERLTFGVNYIYHRRNESLLLNIYGKTDQVYTSLINYGAFFGKRETFGEIGYTKENESKPLFDKYHGGAIQIEWKIRPHLSFFNELGFRSRDGFYGDPSPTTVIYAEHTGSQWHYKGVVNYNHQQQWHALELDAVSNKVENTENIYTYEQEEIGRSYVDYLGTREVGKRSKEHYSIRYTGSFNILDQLPCWQVVAGGDYNHRNIKASNYPDYRRQDLSWWHVNASLERNLSHKRNYYTIMIGSGYGSGDGIPAKDGKYASTNDSETLTRTLDNLLMQEYEYLTTPRFDLDIKLQFTRVLNNEGIKGFVSLEYVFQKAFDTTYTDNALRHHVSLQIGCHF